MSAQKPSGSKFGCYLGWILFLATLPVLAFLATNYTKGQGIVQRETCIANLKEIDEAKEDWALQNKKRVGEAPEAGDLKPILKKSLDEVKCPAGGKYTVNAIGKSPQCSAADHKLP